MLTWPTTCPLRPLHSLSMAGPKTVVAFVALVLVGAALENVGIGLIIPRIDALNTKTSPSVRVEGKGLPRVCFNGQRRRHLNYQSSTSLYTSSTTTVHRSLKLAVASRCT